ncbi:MAG: YfjI family protein [Hyphomicrobiales bacterium]
MSAKGAVAVRKIVDQSREERLEPPRPLIRELPPADPFPVNVLGDILGAATNAINDRVRSPIAICGQSALAAATLAVQGHADIELPTGQVKPISCFFVTVAETGERKSATDYEALWPVRAREKALRENCNRTLPQYENAKVAWDEARKVAVKKAKGNPAAIKLALDNLGPPPTAPLTPMLTCTEPTYEGLVKHLILGQPSVGIFSAEGGQFIGGHGMSDEAMLRTAAGLSCFWDGETITRVRAGDGATILPGRRVALHLMAQADVVAIMLSNSLLLSQGLLSRCLVTAPESNAGSRLWRDPATNSDTAIKRYGARILDILERPLPLVEGRTNELSPRALSLTPDARKIWIGFADNIERQIAPDGALAPVRGLANKLPEHAARLAAVLALVADIEVCAISAEHMSAGVVLVQHYAAEALRMFEGSRVGADLLLAQKLLRWLTVNWTEKVVSLPDIYQHGPNAIRDKATAANLVGLLEDHGWLVRIKNGAVISGQQRRDAWQIIKG